MTKPTKKTKPPIFGKKGELLLEQIIAKKEVYLDSYKPEYSFIYGALEALYQLETIYRQYKYDESLGSLSDAYQERTFYENQEIDHEAAKISIDAELRDDKKIVFFWLTLKIIETLIRGFEKSSDPRIIEISWAMLNKQSYIIGRLKGAEGLDDDIKKLKSYASSFAPDKEFTRKRDAYIRSLIEGSPDRKYLALFADADKNIIGDIADTTFENLCSRIKGLIRKQSRVEK